jgi:hypothetical protein
MRALLGLLSVIATTSGYAQGSRRCGFDLGSPLPAPINARSLAGQYQIEWHPIRRARQRPVRREGLWLWPTSPSDASLQRGGIKPAPGDTIRYALFGTTFPDNANRPTSDALRRATDPIFPPVLLEVGWAPDTSVSTSPPLVLLFETVANRQPDVMSLDGVGVGVSVQHVGAAGFSGSYDRWGIALTDSGFFCARRVL